MPTCLYILTRLQHSMPEQIVIVWDFASGFNIELIRAVLEKYKALSRTPTNQFVLQSWKIDGLTVNVFEKKLVVQGALDEHGKILIQEIAAIEGLRLNSKNQERLAQIFPRKQNAIVCSQCSTSSLLIQSHIEGLEVVFKKECGHSDKINIPFLTLNNRVLPDLNILIAKASSRFIALGYFHGFEVVIPQFVMRVVDKFGGKAQKKAISGELETLRKLADDNKISILNYIDGFQIPSSRTQFENEEDDKILEIAHLTNSVMVTCDENFKDKALLANRPTIYIHSDMLNQIKVIEGVRTPESC